MSDDDALLAVGTLPQDGKRSREVFEIVHRQLRDAVDAGPSGTRPRRVEQIRYRVVGARRGDFHRALRTIANPPGKVPTARRFADEPTEPDALNPSDDLDVNRRHPSSAARARPSQKRGKHRCENSGVGGLRGYGRDVNFTAPDTPRQLLECRRDSRRDWRVEWD